MWVWVGVRMWVGVGGCGCEDVYGLVGGCEDVKLEVICSTITLCIILSMVAPLSKILVLKHSVW